MANIHPPFGTKIENVEKNVTPIWQAFFEDMYNTLGSAAGDVRIIADSITTFSNDGDINIIPTSITFNEVIWPTSYSTNALLTAQSSGQLQFQTANQLGLVPQTGDIEFTVLNTPPSGWVSLDDGTIGNGSSGATTRANADTEELFELLWDTYDNTICPVSSGRGASAQVDFDANKTIALPPSAGRLIGILGSGSGLTTRSNGQTLGTETHTLTESEMPSHSHTVNWYQASGNDPGTYTGNLPVIGSAASITTANFQSKGSDSAHNNMQPTLFLNAMIKL